MSKIDNWDAWKETLAKAIDFGETVGMSEDTINKLAEKIGTFLSNNVNPRNKEERLLKELWDAGDHTDREILAKLVTRIVDKNFV